MSPELQRAFERENWAKLSKEAFWHARRLVSYRWWRGDSQGVLPEGYDPESIANEAVAELFNGKCRLKPGYKRVELRYELRRLVYNQVHRFHRRKGTHLLGGVVISQSSHSRRTDAVKQDRGREARPPSRESWNFRLSTWRIGISNHPASNAAVRAKPFDWSE